MTTRKLGKKMQKYVNAGGTYCPFCGSDNITGEHFESDCCTAWQPVSCDACGRDWQDVYVLSWAENCDATAIKEKDMK